MEDGHHKIFFLRSILAVLVNTLQRVWDSEREMTGWRLGERLDSLFDDGDSDNDLDSEEE